MTDETFEPASQSELCRFVQENSATARRPLYPAGGRTALHSPGGEASPPGVLLSTAQLNRTVDYPARDMTVTVEAGLRVAKLAELLKAEGQQLPVDVSQSNRATVGGAVATNTSGPRRFGHGTFRDYVIGISAVDAQGRPFQAGGRVVKNVAGYDLCKLLVGSQGTLGILTQITFKLKPLPEEFSLLWVEGDDLADIDRMLERLLQSAARPVVLDLLTPRAARHIAAEARLDRDCRSPVLLIGVEGTEREVRWQLDVLQGELSAGHPAIREPLSSTDSLALLGCLTEFCVNTEEPLTFRASLRPSHTVAFVEEAQRGGIAVQAHAGNGIVLGHLPDDVTSAAEAAALLQPLRERASRCGGALTVLQCEEKWKGQFPGFDPLPPGWPVMRQLKEKLDPQGLLNPGRLFPPA